MWHRLDSPAFSLPSDGISVVLALLEEASFIPTKAFVPFLKDEVIEGSGVVSVYYILFY